MTKPVKVLHVIYALSGGGAERQLQFLVKNTPSDSSHGVVCVETRESDLSQYGVEVFVHKRQGKFDWSLFRFCFDTLKTFKPDIVHLWLPPVITIPAMLSAKILGIPIIFSYRNLMRFNRPLDLIAYGMSLLLCNKVISNNLVEQSALPYRFLYSIKKGSTIPNGLDYSSIGEKTHYQVKKDTSVKMIFVGRLVQQKNILNLIRALSYIPRRYLWQLDVYGEGQLKQRALELSEELGLVDQIVFNGYESFVYPKIADSDLLIMPSISEGMPNVLLEALALKIPVVASSIPAITDIIGQSDAVIFVDPNNPQNIAEGICRYIENQHLYINNVDKGAKIAKQYGAIGMAARYCQEYKQLLN